MSKTYRYMKCNLEKEGSNLACRSIPQMSAATSRAIAGNQVKMKRYVLYCHIHKYLKYTLNTYSVYHYMKGIHTKCCIKQSLTKKPSIIDKRLLLYLLSLSFSLSLISCLYLSLFCLPHHNAANLSAIKLRTAKDLPK